MNTDEDTSILGQLLYMLSSIFQHSKTLSGLWLTKIWTLSFQNKDSIEANVENADVHVQQANQQLARAANYQVMPAVWNCPAVVLTYTFL